MASGAPPHDPFYSSPFGPFYRRHTPYVVQPEYRIYEMNKRLQARTEVSEGGRGPSLGASWGGGRVAQSPRGSVPTERCSRE